VFGPQAGIIERDSRRLLKKDDRMNDSVIVLVGNLSNAGDSWQRTDASRHGTRSIFTGLSPWRFSGG
jgi:hypothetical protein